MNPRRKKRLGIVLAIFIGISATIGLMLYALNQNMDLSTRRLNWSTVSQMVLNLRLVSVFVLVVWWL